MMSLVATPSSVILIKNIGELVTLAPLADEHRAHDVSAKDLGRIYKSWLLIKDGKVAETGSMSSLQEDSLKCSSVFDAAGGLLLPGLIDSHTHPLFAGSRHGEFVQRLEGRSYQEIAASGGGIQSTVRNTRAASSSQLEVLLESRARKALLQGVTTLEIKSGYALSVEEELRHLRIMKNVQQKDLHSSARRLPELMITCLALHAVPTEHSKSDFIKACTEQLLPRVHEEKLAQYVDAFVEEGYFSVTDIEDYVEKAKELGIGVRLHADEFSDAGGAAAAATWGAACADHLQFASAEGMRAMGKKRVAATMLPGTSLYTGIPYTDARPFLEAGCPLVIATDFNPGSCLLDNLHFLCTMGALHNHLSLAQSFVAVTYAAACSLGLGKRKGALVKGFDADLALFPLSSLEEWLADAGRTAATRVWFAGEAVRV
ncbi:MAG: imidazolonepropionase [Oligoflexales bacterium]|nr:imidazolonepropionase [Oligoflexales bacterium]